MISDLFDRLVDQPGGVCWKVCAGSGTCDQFGHMSAMRMLKMHSPQVNLIKRRDR